MIGVRGLPNIEASSRGKACHTCGTSNAQRGVVQCALASQKHMLCLNLGFFLNTHNLEHVPVFRDAPRVESIPRRSTSLLLRSRFRFRGWSARRLAVKCKWRPWLCKWQRIPKSSVASTLKTSVTLHGVAPLAVFFHDCQGSPRTGTEMDHVCQLHSCLRTKSCIRCRVLCVKRVTRVPWQSEMESGRRWFSFAWLWFVVCCFRPYCDSNPLRCCQCDTTVGEFAPVMSSSIPCLIPLSTLHHSVRPAVLSFESQHFSTPGFLRPCGLSDLSCSICLLEFSVTPRLHAGVVRVEFQSLGMCHPKYRSTCCYWIPVHPAMTLQVHRGWIWFRCGLASGVHVLLPFASVCAQASVTIWLGHAITVEKPF